MKQVNDFSSWWERNKEMYEPIGVNKLAAKSIWSAACDIMSEQLLVQFEKTIKDK